MKLTVLVNRFARYSRAFQLAVLAGSVAVAAPTFALTINPTFTDNFNNRFGTNAAAAQAAFITAANVFSVNFSDKININITVDAAAYDYYLATTQPELYLVPYDLIRLSMSGDATTSDDKLALSSHGSLTPADPTGGSGNWWVTSAQAKAIRGFADNYDNDGTITFGAGNPFTFSGPILPGTYDFESTAVHEISEVMGRIGIGGESIGNVTNSYSLIDDFAYSGAGARSMGDDGGRYFSIDGGTNLLKLYNNAAEYGTDVVDWADGTNDAFNQYSGDGVAYSVSNVDLQVMDVIGYDRVISNSSVPDSTSTVFLLALAFCSLGGLRRKAS